MKKLLILLLIFSLISCRTFRHTVVADDGTVTVEEVPIEEHVPITPIEIVTPEEMDAIMADEPVVESAAETVPDPVEEITEEEPIVPLETYAEDKTGEPESPFSGEVVIAGTNLPPWFVYTASGLILAMLLTVCYISKQRKESYWHRAPRD